MSFKIRPYDKRTFEAWKQGNYTEGEQDFMNFIELTPELLEQTFGAKWKEELANFLKNIGHSSCFKDSLLLTKAECENTRIFTQKVHLKLYENILKKFENQDGGSQSGRTALPSIGGFRSIQLI
jgi:hypothetical protein